MGALVYFSCALTSALCAWLLLRSYATTRYKLLLWCGLCFVGLFLNNMLLLLDKVVFPDVSFGYVRPVMSIVALLPLLYGLILEE